MALSNVYGGVHVLGCVNTYNWVLKVVQAVARGERNICVLFGIAFLYVNMVGDLLQQNDHARSRYWQNYMGLYCNTITKSNCGQKSGCFS